MRGKSRTTRPEHRINHPNHRIKRIHNRTQQKTGSPINLGEPVCMNGRETNYCGTRAVQRDRSMPSAVTNSAGKMNVQGFVEFG